MMGWQDDPVFNQNGIVLGTYGKTLMLIVDGRELGMPMGSLDEFKAHMNAFIDQHTAKEA